MFELKDLAETQFNKNFIFFDKKIHNNHFLLQAAGIWYPNENVGLSYWLENAENRIGRPDAAKRAEVDALTCGLIRDAAN